MLTHRLDERFKEFDLETQKKLALMHERHKREMEEFEKEWRDVVPEKYRRAPKKLLELRDTAKALAKAGQFDEAQTIKLEADALEQEEQKEAQARLNKDYRIAKNMVMTKNKYEVQQYSERRRQKRELLEVHMNQLQESSKNRSVVLKSKPAPSRAISRDVTNEKFVITSPVSSKKGIPKGNLKLPPLQPPNVKKSN